MVAAAGDAHTDPIFGGRWRVVFPIFDNTGAIVADAAGLDSERSIDQGTFVDCTNEASQIASSSGIYYLDLTTAEMSCSCIAIIVKTSTTNAKPTVIIRYPRRMPVLHSGTAQAGAASTITLDTGASDQDAAYVGCYVQHTGNTPAGVEGQTRKIVSYVGSTRVATVNAAWGSNPSSATAFSILIPETANSANELALPSDIATAVLAAGVATTADVDAVQTIVDDILVDTGTTIPATLTGLPDAILDLPDGVETDLTLRQAERIKVAALAGKASGLATTTAVYRDTNDSVNRITATVDASGNRTAVTLNAS